MWIFSHYSQPSIICQYFLLGYYAKKHIQPDTKLHSFWAKGHVQNKFIFSIVLSWTRHRALMGNMSRWRYVTPYKVYTIHVWPFPVTLIFSQFAYWGEPRERSQLFLSWLPWCFIDHNSWNAWFYHFLLSRRFKTSEKGLFHGTLCPIQEEATFEKQPLDYRSEKALNLVLH